MERERERERETRMERERERVGTAGRSSVARTSRPPVQSLWSFIATLSGAGRGIRVEVDARPPDTAPTLLQPYRGTTLIRNRLLLGPYSRPCHESTTSIKTLKEHSRRAASDS